MTIVLYVGARGRGKTLTMVKDGYQYYLNGFKILRNFNCKFGDYIENDEILKLDKDSSIKNAVIMIDEIQIFFDSRRGMKKENIDFSNFVQQIRKRNIILLCTTQYSNTIDLRLRQHLNYLVYPMFNKELEVCEVVYKDLNSIEENLLTGVIQEPKQVQMVYDCKPIFKLYDTNQMIV